MPKLEQLRPHLSEVADLQVQADGYALWMVWNGSANVVVLQTLEDYGGLKIAEDEQQSLWYFFSLDVLLAAARLGVWARFNPLALGLQIFPARFLAGHDGEKQLIFDESLWQQRLQPPPEYRVWVHSAMSADVEMSPGLTLKETGAGDGPDPQLWHTLEVDARLPYQSPLSWYAVLRPVGNVQDKAFILGWREFFAEVEALLQRNKFRFSLYDFYLVFPLEGLRQVQNWCRDYLNLVDRLKSEAPDRYWPCVMAVVDRKGLSMNEDLPHKIQVEWEHLIPDYPHMSMRNALMLGDEFIAHEARFAAIRHQPDDWASISLRSEEGDDGSMPQLAPVNLIFGKYEYCFYCGQRSHTARECPSRLIDPQAGAVWNKIARMDLHQMRTAVSDLDRQLEVPVDEESLLDAVESLLKEDTPAAQMLRAYYDLLWPAQIRAASFFWRARNKDLQKAAKSLTAIDNNPLWDELQTFSAKSEEELDQELHTIALKYSKDFRLLSLRGFQAVERGELEKAEKLWKEAEMASPHPIVQSWHTFLQARTLEMRGQLTAAAALYDQVARACPTWLDAEYRRVVCLIKSGFTGTGLQSLTALIDKSGHFFNRALIDPELERGFIQVLACLYGLWTSMEERAREEVTNLTRMRDELGTWFMPDNDFAAQIAERIDKILQIESVKNYVAFQRLVTGRIRIEKDIQAHVLQQAKDYKASFRSYNARLKTINEESAWFPFPRALADFNRSYNEGVANVNWALTANFHAPEPFRKAQMLVEQERERIKKLESRLRFLRIVRDTTLFILSMAQTFFWLEIVGCLLIFAVLPLFLLYGDKLGFDSALTIFSKDRWPVQKALLIVVTVLAVGIAGLRTIMRFETIRDKILSKARASAVKASRRE